MDRPERPHHLPILEGLEPRLLLNALPLAHPALSTEDAPRAPVYEPAHSFGTTDEGVSPLGSSNHDPQRPVLVLPGIVGTFPAEAFVDEWFVTRGIEPERPVEGSPGEYETILEIDPIGGFYNDILQTLKNHGYVENQTLFVAAYDWRLPVGPNDGVVDGHLDGLTGASITDGQYHYGVDYLGYWLGKAADTWRDLHGEGPASVDLITHSTGGLVARAYIQSDAYGDIYEPIGQHALPEVNHLVMVGVPNRGASKAWNALHDNYAVDPAYRAIVSKIGHQAYVRLAADNGVDRITGPDGDITLADVTDPATGAPDFQRFIALYVPTIGDLMATYPFLLDGPDGQPRDINDDGRPPEIGQYRNDLLLDLNAGLDYTWSLDDAADGGLLDLDAGDPSPFVPKLLGRAVVIYSQDVKTVTLVQPRTGLDEYNSLAPPIVQLDQFVGRFPAPGEAWYEDIPLTDQPLNGDGTVPVESSLGQFLYDPRFLGDDAAHVLYGAALPQAEDTGSFFGLLADPAYSITHTGLLGNRQVQAFILDQLGIEVSDPAATIATGLANNPLVTLDVAIRRGILSIDGLDATIPDAAQAELLEMLDWLELRAGQIDAGPAMTTPLPVMGTPIASVLSVEELVGEQLADPIRGYLTSTGAPTFLGLAGVLWDQAATLDDLALPQWQDGELLLHIPLRATGAWEAAPTLADYHFGLHLDAGLSLQGRAQGSLELVLGFDLDADAQQVYVQPGQVSVDIDVQAIDIHSGLRIGMIEAGIADGAVSFWSRFTAGWQGMGQDRLTVTELSSTHGLNLVRDSRLQGAFEANLPFQIGALGLQGSGAVSVSLPDITQPTDIDVTVEGMEALADLRNLTAHDVISLLRAMPDTALSWLEGQGYGWLYTPLPVLGRSAADLLNDARSILAQLEALANQDLSLSGLIEAVEDQLGLNRGAIQFALDVYDDAAEEHGVRLTLSPESTAWVLLDQAHTWTLDTDLLAAMFGTNWSATLGSLIHSEFGGTVDGLIRVELNLHAGLDLHLDGEGIHQVKPFLGEQTGLTVSLLVDGREISLDQTVLPGVTMLWVRDGYVQLGATAGEPGAPEPATLVLGLAGGSGGTQRRYFGPDEPELTFSASLTGGFEAGLPMYYGDESGGPGAALPLDADSPALRLTVQDLNQPANIDWDIPAATRILDDLDGLSPAQMLDLFVRLAHWFDGLADGQLLSQRLPFTNRSLGDLLELGRPLLDLATDLSEEAFTTYQQLAHRLEDLLDTQVVVDDHLLSFPVTFQRQWVADGLGFHQELPGLAIDRRIDGDLVLTADVTMSLDIELDLSALSDGGDWADEVLDRVFIGNLDVAAELSLSAEQLTAAAQWGLLGLVVDAEGLLAEGRLLTAGVSMSALEIDEDNGDNGEEDSLTSLRTLMANLPTIHRFISAPLLEGQAHLMLPLDVLLTAQDPGTGQPDASLLDLLAPAGQPRIEVEWNWQGLAEPHDTRIQTHDMDALLGFSQLHFGDLLQMLRSLGQMLGQLANEAALNWTVPMTGGRTMGELIDLGDLYAQRLLHVVEQFEQAHETGQVNYQQLRRLLIDELGLDDQSVALDSQSLQFHLSLAPLMSDWNSPFSFQSSLGPFTFATGGTVQGEVFTGLDMTLGLDFAPPPLELVAPRAMQTHLTGDVSFQLAGVRGAQPVTVTVAAGNYGSAAQLVDAVNAALAEAGVDHLVQADSVLRPDPDDSSRTLEHLALRTLPAPAAPRHLGIHATATPAGLARLGFETGQSVTRSLAELLFLDSVQVNAALGLSVDDFHGGATFGSLVELGVVNGRLALADTEGAGPAWIAAALLAPDDQAGQPGRIYLSELRHAQLDELTYQASAELQFSLDARIPGLLDLAPHDNRVTIAIPDLADPQAWVFDPEPSGLEDLFSLELLSLEQLLDALELLIDSLLEQGRLAVMDQTIPVLNMTGAELLAYVGPARALIQQLRSDPGIMLNGLADRVEAILPEGGRFGLTLPAAEGDLPPSLQMDLHLGYAHDLHLPFDLDLASLLGDGAGALGRLVNVSAEGRLQVTAEAAMALGVGVELSPASGFAPFLARWTQPLSDVPAQPTGMQFALAFDGGDLQFDAALGPFGIHVEHGSAVLSHQAGEPGSASIGFDFTGVSAQDFPRLYLSQALQWIDHASLSVQAALAVNLPIYFPTRNQRLVDGDGKPQSLELVVSDLDQLLLGGTPEIQYVLPDFTAFEIEFDLSLMLQGLEMLLAQIGTALDDGAFGRPLPVVGNLTGAASFMHDMAGAVADLREALPEDTSWPSLAQWLATETTAALRNVLGLDPLDDSFVIELLTDTSEPKPELIEFELGLVGFSHSLGMDIGFDLGLPGLGLEMSDVVVQTALVFGAQVGFGYHRDNGFVLRDDSFVGLQLDAMLDLGAIDAGEGVTARLGFLEFLAGGTAEMDASLHLAVTEDVTFAELLSTPLAERFDFAWGLLAEVDFELMVQFAGGSTSFPSIRSDLFVGWGWGDRTSLTHPEVPRVVLTDVRLDLGQFIGDTIGPVVTWIDDLLEPIRPLVEFLSEPLPGISDLAGRNISLLDMAREMTAHVDFPLIDAVIGITEVVAMLPTIGEGGSIVLVDVYVLGEDPREPFVLDLDTINYIEGSDSVEDQPSAGFFQTLYNLGFAFPLLDQPSQAIGLLFGQDVDLIVYDMPALELGFDFRLNFPFWSPPTIAVSIGAGIGLKIDPVFGYDTRGARTYLNARKQYELYQAGELDEEPEPPSAAMLLNGFYALADTARPPFSLGAEVFAGLMVNAGVKAGLDGVIALDAHLHFKDPQNLGKLYVDQLLAYRDTTLGLFCAFHASGEISAQLRFWYDAWLISGEYTIVSVTLFDFNAVPECLPLDEAPVDSNRVRRLEDFDRNAPLMALDAGIAPGVNRGTALYAALDGTRTVQAPDPDNPGSYIELEVDTHGVNWYRVELLHPDDLLISMRETVYVSGVGTMRPGRYYVGIFDESGEPIARNATAGAALEVQNLPAGVYYVGVGRPVSNPHSPSDGHVYGLSIRPGPTSNTIVWYVNDEEYEHSPLDPTHYYTLAVGSDDNDGRSPYAPLPSLNALPAALNPSYRHMVVLDTGHYMPGQVVTQSGLTLAGTPGIEPVSLASGETFETNVGQSIILHGHGNVGLHLSEVHSTLVYGLTFHRPDMFTPEGPGLYLTGAGETGMGPNVIRNSLFISPGEAAIFASSAQPVVVEQNLFVGEPTQGNGVEIVGNTRATIRDNTFRLDSAVRIDSPFYSQVRGNDIASYVAGVLITAGGNARISNNSFSGGQWGVIIRTERESVVENNTFTDIAWLGVLVDQPNVPTFMAVDFERWPTEPIYSPPPWHVFTLDAGTEGPSPQTTESSETTTSQSTTTNSPTGQLPQLQTQALHLDRQWFAQIGQFLADFSEPTYRHLIVNNELESIGLWSIGLATQTPTKVQGNTIIDSNGVVVFGENADAAHLIEYNRVEDGLIGVAVVDAAVAEIRDNRISGSGYGVWLMSERDSLVQDNHISGGLVGVQVGRREDDTGPLVGVFGSAMIAGNTITRVETGIRLDTLQTVPIEGNWIEIAGAGGTGVLGTGFGAAAHLVNNRIFITEWETEPVGVRFQPNWSDVGGTVPDTFPPDTPAHLLRGNTIRAVHPSPEIIIPTSVWLMQGPGALIEGNSIHGTMMLTQHSADSRPTTVTDNRITEVVMLVVNGDTTVSGNTIGRGPDAFLPADRGGIMIQSFQPDNDATHRLYGNTIRGGMLADFSAGVLLYLPAIGIYNGGRVEIVGNTLPRGGIVVELPAPPPAEPDMPSLIEANTVTGGLRLTGGPAAVIHDNSFTDDAVGRQQLETILSYVYGGSVPDEAFDEHCRAVFEAGVWVDTPGAGKTVVSDNVAPAGVDLAINGPAEVLDNQVAEGELHITGSSPTGHRVKGNLIGLRLRIQSGPHATVLGNTVLNGDMTVHLYATPSDGDPHAFTHLRDNDVAGKVTLTPQGRARVEHNTIAEGLYLYGTGTSPHIIDHNHIGGRLAIHTASDQPHRIRGNTIEGDHYGILLSDGVAAEIEDNPLIQGQTYGIYGLQPGAVVIQGNPHVEGANRGVWLNQPHSVTIGFNEIVGGVYVKADSQPPAEGRVQIYHNIIRDGNQHGVELLVGDRLAMFTVEHNTIHGHAGSGVHYGGLVFIADNSIFDNMIGITGEHAVPAPWFLTQAVIVGNEIYDNSFAGIAASPLLIENNHIHGNRVGILIPITPEGYQHFVGRIENNMIQDNGLAGIMMLCKFVDALGTLTPIIINNTVFEGKGDALRVIFQDDASQGGLVQPIEVVNNILVGAGAGALFVPNVLPAGLLVSDYNLYHGDPDAVITYMDDKLSLVKWRELTGQDANSLQADPHFVDWKSGDLRLAPGSPAIDRGHSWEAPRSDRDGFWRVDDPDTANAGSDDYVEHVHDTSEFAPVGTPLGWQANDDALLLDLPFLFPFYDQTFDEVWVSSNGWLQFGGTRTSARSPNNDVFRLGARQAIAPLWTNLYTEELFVRSSPEAITFRWQARIAATNEPVNVAATLFADGVVRFDYGPGNTGLPAPTIGISGFSSSVYLLSRYDGAENLDKAPSLTFALAPGHVDLGTYEYRVRTGLEDLVHVRGTTPSELHDPAPGGDPPAPLLTEPLTRIVLEFSGPLDVATVGEPMAVELKRAGPDGGFGSTGTVIDVLPTYAIGSTWDGLEQSLILHVRQGVLESGEYRLTLSAKVLTDLLGRPIDGNNDGKPGEDYVRFFTVAPTGIQTWATPPLVTSPFGDTAQVDVALTAKPLHPVHVRVAVSDPHLADVSHAVLTFTPSNWSTPQTITLYGRSDALEPNRTYQLHLSALFSQDPRFDAFEPVALDVLHRPDDVESQVVGRYAFYNNSYLDGGDPAAGPSDDDAIAANKTALLPGQTATSANHTGYSRGINGIMVDIDGLSGQIGIDDFVFRVGNSDDVLSWDAAPAPESISVRFGAGEGGSNRVTIIWADHAIRNQWLQVTVRATSETGLADDDVFYFGNLSGDANSDGTVDLDDFVALKNSFGMTGGGISGGDFNLTGVTDLDDFVVLKNAFGAQLARITIPEHLVLSGNADAYGAVEMDAYVILKTNFGSTNATWDQGDFDGNGTVDLDDFVLLKNSFARTTDSFAPAVDLDVTVDLLAAVNHADDPAKSPEPIALSRVRPRPRTMRRWDRGGGSRTPMTPDVDILASPPLKMPTP